jgi:hypothetical protein
LPILFTLMMEAIHSSEMSVFTRATYRNIPEDGILNSYCHENLSSYIDLYSLTANKRKNLMFHSEKSYTKFRYRFNLRIFSFKIRNSKSRNTVHWLLQSMAHTAENDRKVETELRNFKSGLLF